MYCLNSYQSCLNDSSRLLQTSMVVCFGCGLCPWAFCVHEHTTPWTQQLAMSREARLTQWMALESCKLLCSWGYCLWESTRESREIERERENWRRRGMRVEGTSLNKKTISRMKIQSWDFDQRKTESESFFASVLIISLCIFFFFFKKKINLQCIV